MKIVEKKPAEIAYQCELCKSEYEAEATAVACEKFHITTVGLTSKEFFDKDAKYPNVVNIRMSDNSIQRYSISSNIPTDILQNVTNSAGITNLALVDSYKVTVKKEQSVDDKVTSEVLSNVNVVLQDGKLYVNIPDEINVTTADVICVKVVDKNGYEVTAESENSPFNQIVITAEVTQTLENRCVE